MEFLNLDDLKAHSFPEYIDESTAGFTEARDLCELQGIAMIKSKLSARYNVEEIFEETGEGRNALIVRILTAIVIRDIIARNAARKVPDDIKAEYKWALFTLDSIRDRKESPVGLPEKTDSEGNPKRAAVWGNNSNENHYL